VVLPLRFSVPFLLSRLLAIALLSLIAATALAQDGRDLTDEQRRQYIKELGEASALVRDKQYDDALAKLGVLLAQRPREPQARFLKGVVQTDQGHVDAAIATFTALTDDYPEIPEPWNNLAVLYAQKGEYESARIALENAVKSAPDWGLAHENLGDIYARLAATQYDRAAKLDKDNKTAAAKLVLARDLLAKR
jgi:tetratricopeptide (TPR) repeat protein